MKINIYDAKKPLNHMHSWEAESGARSLLERIDSVDLVLEILPNDYSQYTGVLEEKDWVSYGGFLGSMTGRRILDALEELDEK